MANKRLLEGECVSVEYTKASSGEVTNRVIIPTFVPNTNIKALDVTSLNEDDADQLAKLVREYNNYLTDHMKSAFKFEDWVEQTQNTYVEVSWRTFKTDGLKVL